MMRQLILLLSFVVMPTLAAAQETVDSTLVTENRQGYSFAFFSRQTVLEAMDDYRQAQKSLDVLQNTYDKEMARAEEVLNKQFAEYVEGQHSFPENILLKRQKELQQLMQQSLSFKEEAKQLLIKAEQDLVGPVRQRLADMVRILGEERGYDFIIDTDAETHPFINTRKGVDVTRLLIQRLN